MAQELGGLRMVVIIIIIECALIIIINIFFNIVAILAYLRMTA